MNNKVKFLRGTSGKYAVAEKDNDTIYFTTDDGKLYIGDKEVSGDGSVTIDDTLSDTSTNPVQNKVVKQAIDNKADKTVATTDTDGLMSAADKTKLDNADDTYALKSKYGDTTINVGRKAGSDIGACSTAEGLNTTASGYASHAEGSNAYISNGEIAFYDTRAVTISDDVTVEVDSSKAYGINSHAEGCQTLAYGNCSHAEGRQTTASGGGSHAEGSGTVASGAQSHAEGVSTVASGSRSHAEGILTTASGASCHAEGKETTANGNNSCHAEGALTTANGIASHAEGNSNNKATDLIPDLSWQTTTDEEIINAWNTQQFSLAHGGASHVEGSNNLALGHASHAGGQYTVAIGDHAHTSGYYTKALHENEAAYGKYNVSNDDTLFSIGDGTADDARHNAFEITTTGGKLHDKDIATIDVIPTSLPADGGNADTLDGLHAADFANAYNDYLGTYLVGKSGDIRELAYLLPTGGLWANTKFPELENITFPIEGDILITWDKSKYIQYGYIYGVLTIRPMTSTGDTYICSVYNTTSYTDWQKIADGGNADTVDGRHCGRIATLDSNGNYWSSKVEDINDAYLQWDGSKYFRLKTYGENLTHVDNSDTVDGLHAADFVNANDKDQIQIPNNVDAPAWIYANGKRYQEYMTNGDNIGMTNIPNGSNDWVWYFYDGLNILAHEWVTGRYYICDTINGGVSGWKDIYTSGFKPYVTGEVSVSYSTETQNFAVLDFTPSVVICKYASRYENEGTIKWATPITNGFSVTVSSTEAKTVSYIAFR